MSILLNNHPFDNQPWVDALAKLLPQMPVQVFPDVSDRAAIRYAAIWDHPHHDLNHYPNLEAILVLGAGMDLIDQQPGLPDVPIVRLVDPAVGHNMGQYVLYWSMHFQRGYERYRAQQKDAHWQRHAGTPSQDFRISILGLGMIGEYIARLVAGAGFHVQAWSRSLHQVEGVDCFAGDAGLGEMLSATDVLVNCLPLKPQTRGLLNYQRLSLLPKGSALISISRGAIVDEQALIKLLNEGHLLGAALDCFIDEPLPGASQLWTLTGVHITPHMSGATYASAAAQVLVDNILRLERGEAAFPLYRPEPA